MAKRPLRDITPKGDTKLLSDKLKGVNKSETKPLDLDDFLMDPDNMKGSKDFIKKHEVQKHDDRVGNKEAPYRSSKGEAKYERADGKMYEAADCTCSDDKEDDSCAVHGKKGKKLLLGGKKNSMAEDVEFSTLDTTPGLVPAGMQAVAKNLWNTAENHLTGPTVANGQGRPFIAKLGDEIKQLQKEAVEIMHGQIDEKLTDDAKMKIRSSLSDKMKKDSKPARALIKLAKANKDNIKEEELDEVRIAVKPSDYLSGARKPRPDIPTGVRGHAYDIVKKFHAAPREKQYEMLRKKADALGTKHSDNKIKREIDFFHKNKEHYGIGEETELDEARIARTNTTTDSRIKGHHAPGPTTVRGICHDVVKQFPKAPIEKHYELAAKKMGAVHPHVPESTIKSHVNYYNKNKKTYGIGEETELDEVSKELAQRYMKPALNSRDKADRALERNYNSSAHTRSDDDLDSKPTGQSKAYDKAWRTAGNRDKGIERAMARGAKLKEDAPPSKSSEEWIKKNKARFKKEYGAEKGERVLYGKAWNDYKEKH